MTPRWLASTGHPAQTSDQVREWGLTPSGLVHSLDQSRLDVKILYNFREASDWLSAVTLLFTLYLRSPECRAAAAGETANLFSPALSG